MTPAADPASTHPPVFIGMPIYNEGDYIADALADLTAQDYPNLTILISDNASTDQASEICRGYAARHAHIQYQRLEHNCGVTDNFRRVREAAEGDYFMWAAGHDRWESNYLSECVELLESHPEAAIAFGSGDWIDANGERMKRESGFTDTRGMTPIARYFSAIWGNMHPILGLIRLSYLHRAHEPKPVTGSDLIMLTELALMGDFLHADDTAWRRREPRGDETYDQKLKRYRSAQFGLTKSRLSRMLPLAQLPIELFRVVFRARLPLSQKTMLSFLLLPTFLVKYLSSRK